MQIALTWLGKAVVCSYYSSHISKKAFSQGSLTFTNYYFLINMTQKKKASRMLQTITVQHEAKHIFLSHKCFTYTISRSSQYTLQYKCFNTKQINLRPWAKPVSHTPRTPLSISSQIFPQVEIHLFCRANIETCLHTVLYLSTAVLNNCCKINQIFIALGEFDAIKSSSSLNFLSHSLKKSMSI